MMEKYGVAIDYGTSMIRAALTDLNSCKMICTADCPNDLQRYGPDILTRIACCTENNNKKEEVFRTARETLRDVLEKLTEKSGINAYAAEKVIIAANTTHMYLLLRQDPACICIPPYEIPLHAPGWLDGRELDPGLSENCRLFFVPCKANYLGGDVLCALLALGLDRMRSGSALFDMGQNGELVIRSGDILYCGSCAAGCALTVDNCEELSADNKESTGCRRADAEPEKRQITGSQMTSFLADLYRSGVVSPRGRLQTEGHPEVRQIQEAGKTRPSLIVNLPGGYILRQADISGYMQAKASAATMIDYMTEVADLDKNDLNAFYLTGRLGENLDPEAASATGLLPIADLSIVTKIRDAVLTGAVMLLTDMQKFRELDVVYGMLHYVQLREIDDYLELMLPHLTLPCF